MSINDGYNQEKNQVNGLSLRFIIINDIIL